MGGFNTIAGLAPHHHSADPKQGGALKKNETIVDGEKLGDLCKSISMFLIG